MKQNIIPGGKEKSYGLPPIMINEPYQEGVDHYLQEALVQPLKRPVEELSDGQDLYEVHDIFVNHDVIGPLVELADSELDSDLFIFGSVRSNLFVGDGVRFRVIYPAIQPDYEQIRRDFDLPAEFAITDNFLRDKVKDGYRWGFRIDLDQLDLAEVRVRLGVTETEEITEQMLLSLPKEDLNYLASMRVFDHSAVNDMDACVVASPTQFEKYVRKLESGYKDKNIKVSHLKPPLTSREHIRVEIDEAEFNIYRIGDPKDEDKDVKDLSRTEKSSLIDQFSKNILIQNDRAMVRISPDRSLIHDPFKVLNRIKYTDRVRLRDRPIIPKYMDGNPGYLEALRKRNQGIALEPANRVAYIELNTESEKYRLLIKIKALADLDREPTETELDEVRGWELFELLQQIYRLYRKEAANEVLPSISAEEAEQNKYRVDRLNNSWVYDIHRFLERYMDPKYNLFPDEIGTMTQEEIIELFNLNATRNCVQALARAYKQSYPRDEASKQLTENPYTSAINKIPIMRYLFPTLFDTLLPGVEGIPLNLLTHDPADSQHLLNHMINVNAPNLSEADAIYVANRLRVVNWFFEYITDNVHDPFYIGIEPLDINSINEYLAVVIAACLVADSMISITDLNYNTPLESSPMITFEENELARLLQDTRWSNAITRQPLSIVDPNFSAVKVTSVGLDTSRVLKPKLNFTKAAYTLRYPRKLIEDKEYRLSITQPIV